MDSTWLAACENDAILEAAFSFLAENDAGDSLPAATPSRGTTRATPGNSARTYYRRKEQIDTLREEVKRLESSIARMRVQQGTNVVVSDTWEAIAARQLSQRFKVEAKNQHLREMVQEQEDLLQQLKRLVLDREAHVKRTLGWRGRAHDAVASSEDLIPSDSATLESVTSSLLPMYFQTEWVLSQPELQRNGRRAVSKQQPGISRPASHVLNSRIVPFDLDTTTGAVWAGLLSQLGSKYEALQRPGNVVRSQHDKVVVEMPGFRSVVRITMALQRFDEDDRVVFVRKSAFTFLDPDERNGCIVFPGLTVRQSLWTIVQKAQFPGLSQIRTVSASIPAFAPKTEAQAVTLDRFLTDLSLLFSEFADEDIDNRLLRGKGRSLFPSVAIL